MPKRFTKEALGKLRNDIPIAMLIAGILELPSKNAGGYFRFLCPLCGGFDTATNPRTNLARCFACEQNFNTIDITMTVKRQNFREAVQFLRGIQTVNTKELCTNLAATMSTQSQQSREK